MDRKLSIVIPSYNEEESLEELYDNIVVNVQKCMDINLISDYELIFVDDGSSDQTALKIRSINEKNNRVHLISFRRNLGKATALQTAFRNVTGEIIITMDADLQDDPVEIKKFICKIDEGFDLVSGWKVNRLDPLEKRIPSRMFNKVTSKVFGISLHDFNCGFKAYRREVVDSLNIYGELHRYIPVLADKKGYRIAEIPVHHNRRKFGKSKYGADRYLHGLFDLISVLFISKFYDRPMYLFGEIALGIFGGGVIMCLIPMLRFVMRKTADKKKFFMGILLIIFGMQSALTGLIADMIVDATHNRKYTEDYIQEMF